MNSFTLTAVGNLARDPELVRHREMNYTRLCLIGNDYAGRDPDGAAREVATSVWFVAFGTMGEALARHGRIGDQLFINARIRGNRWADAAGLKQYDHEFVIEGFRFGAAGRAKREDWQSQRAAQSATLPAASTSAP